MIREINNTSEICTDWPVFCWVKCAKTNVEVRREKVYRKLVGPFINGFGRWAYVRASAVNGKQGAAEFFARNAKPSGPPPSPSGK